ncbi:MAG: FIST C-terminal domain-containing protein [Chitinophagaceae bacterium]|nr:FIST C-terminal domain-containing protein [Chitinophagaceae bacterium]
MKAKTINGSSTEAIKSSLDNSMVDGYKPTLAIVFLSVKQDRTAICQLLDGAGIAIYGITTNGEFTGDGITSGESAILLLDVNHSYFHIICTEYAGTDYRLTTQEIAKKAKEIFNNPSFLIGVSNLNADAEALLHGFEDILGKDVNVSGAMAGDDFQFIASYVFTNHISTSNGIVTLVFDEDHISIKGRATFGWKALGTVRTVTKSEGNHVYTIDDIPALDLTIKYGGLENVTPENFALEHSIALTFQIQRETGDPVMRAGLLVDWNDHSIYCAGPLPQGSKIRFSLPPEFDVIEKVISGCEDLKATEIPDADAIILFNCAGRLLSLGPLISDEIEGIQNVWKVPIAGMFSNAELARATNGNLEMHGFTACTVVLKEK